MEAEKLLKLEKLVETLSEKINSVENNQNRQLSDFDSSDTAWMLASCSLVLMMTIPGLALFYGGMARSKNVLAVVMQCFTITCLITFLWLTFGYSLSFAPVLGGDDDVQVFGDASRFWLVGMSPETYHQLATTIPESVFCVYQLTFAIITAALITGAFAERMKFSSMLLFMTLWHLTVYCPIAHSTWHPLGFLFRAGALDFAGGNAVHISSGFSGLACAVYLGVRRGYGKEAFEPHNILLTAVGSSLLWVGWFGFNAGSAVAANSRAGYAMLVTQISSGVAALSWLITEWIVRKRPSVLGTVSGAIAGLVSITPASGYVDQTGAFIIGLVAGPICYGGAQLKRYFGYDDALDAFGVHGIGGVLGGLLTGFFAKPEISGLDDNAGVFYADTYHGGRQLGRQIYAIVCAVFWSLFMTTIILFTVDALMGLRVTDDDEELGLDASLHGETVTPNGIVNKYDPAHQQDPLDNKPSATPVIAKELELTNLEGSKDDNAI
jgi:ammonium transporter, Amt family